jgi:hypothetical protein
MANLMYIEKNEQHDKIPRPTAAGSNIKISLTNLSKTDLKSRTYIANNFDNHYHLRQRELKADNYPKFV